MNRERLKLQKRTNQTSKHLLVNVKKNFEIDSQIKVREHCHSTEDCREAAHQQCNVIVREGQPSFVRILFGNFTNYDSQLLSRTKLSNSPIYK